MFTWHSLGSAGLCTSKAGKHGSRRPRSHEIPWPSVHSYTRPLILSPEEPQAAESAGLRVITSSTYSWVTNPLPLARAWKYPSMLKWSSTWLQAAHQQESVQVNAGQTEQGENRCGPLLDTLSHLCFCSSNTTAYFPCVRYHIPYNTAAHWWVRVLQESRR